MEDCMDIPTETNESSEMSDPIEESETIEEYLADSNEGGLYTKYQFISLRRDKPNSHYHSHILKTFSPPPEQA